MKCFISFFCNCARYWNLKEKIYRSAFSKKVLVCPKISKKGLRWTQNDGFLTFHKKFSLLFAISNLKWKKLQSPTFLCKPHIREKFWFSVIGENDLVQSDCRIIWSSISLEGIHQYLSFFAWRCSPRKDNMWGYFLWMGVSRHEQPCPGLHTLSREPFGLVLGDF